MISFIIPYRDRPQHLRGSIDTISRYYPEAEILFSCQDDSGLFLRGQLCNLGFRKSSGDLLVFLDVDIRFLSDPNFDDLMSEHKKPFLPFNRLVDLKELEIGTYEAIETVEMKHGFGACSVITRKQFIASNGFSNLPRGWGGEDNILDTRLGGFHRLDLEIGHVRHESGGREGTNRNADLFWSDKERNMSIDSFRETTATEEPVEILGDRIGMFHFKDIGVPDDFAYSSLME